MDRAQWPALKARFADAVPHAHERASGSSSSPATRCASRRSCRCRRRAPIRTTSSAATFVDVGGAPQPAPAPRFSRTPSAVQGPPVAAGADTDTALAEWGFAADDVADLKAVRRHRLTATRTGVSNAVRRIAELTPVREVSRG